MAGMRWADESYVVSFTGNSCVLWWKTCQRASRSLSVLQMSSKGSGIRLSYLSAVPSIERLDPLGDRGRKKDSNGITTTNQQLPSSE